MSEDSISSSLYTDSDMLEDKDQIFIPDRVKKQKEYKVVLHKPGRSGKRHRKNKSSSQEISSSSSLSDENVIENVSRTGVDELTTVNKTLTKKLSNALMNYKSVSRPLIENSSVPQEEVSNYIRLLDHSLPAGVSDKDIIIWSLEKVKEIKNNIQSKVKTINSSRKEIEDADLESNLLKQKIDQITDDLRNIAEKRKVSSKACCSFFKFSNYFFRR